MAAMRVAALMMTAASAGCMGLAMWDRDLFWVTAFGFMWITSVVLLLELARGHR